MKADQQLPDIFDRLRKDLRSFISLSLKESESTWEQWLSVIRKDISIRCWEKKSCDKVDCPAYKSACGRCWLIAGTMCGDKPVGKFAQKYRSCIECDVYQEAVLTDPSAEVYEHLITLVYSLRDRQLELKTLAMHDTLTGLHNRNFFDLMIKQEIKKIKRYGGGFTVFMIDIDNFKFLNDRYGHLHGDGVLREVASILKKSIRGADLLIRYGGDEFIIIRHELSTDGDTAMIDRVSQNIAAWNDEYGSDDYKLSCSYGAAFYNRDKEIACVLAEADSEMYKNKEYNRRQKDEGLEPPH